MRLSDLPSEAVGPPARARKKKTKPGAIKAAWQRLRQPLAESRFVKSALASFLYNGLRFVRLTNPLHPQSLRLTPQLLADEPYILALWHGQHILAPALYHSQRKLVAMVSKSADAELNALVLERFGVSTVRGSGGRAAKRTSADKGGARALIQLKKALEAGSNVCMIADIPHGTPRDAGEGIILLARLSGRPILPAAIATSRRKVLARSWDKTTINLPFGHSILCVGDKLEVPPDADEARMEAARRQLTVVLDATFEKAYRLIDAPR